MTNKCFSAHCTNDAMENGVLCVDHYEKLPAHMRGEQAPSKDLATRLDSLAQALRLSNLTADAKLVQEAAEALRASNEPASAIRRYRFTKSGMFHDPEGEWVAWDAVRPTPQPAALNLNQMALNAGFKLASGSYWTNITGTDENLRKFADSVRASQPPENDWCNTCAEASRLLSLKGVADGELLDRIEMAIDGREDEPDPALRPDGMPEPSLDVLKRVAARMRTDAPDSAYLAEWAAEQIEEHNQSFDLRWKADMRAIKRWQEANPGNDLTWPDHADMCVWLLEQLDARAAQPPGDVIRTRSFWSHDRRELITAYVSADDISLMDDDGDIYEPAGEETQHGPTSTKGDRHG